MRTRDPEQKTGEVTNLGSFTRPAVETRRLNAARGAKITSRGERSQNVSVENQTMKNA